MSLIDKLNETQNELSLMGQSIYSLAEIVATIEQHVKLGFGVYEDNEELLSDLKLMRSMLDDMNKVIYDDEIIL